MIKSTIKEKYRGCVTGGLIEGGDRQVWTEVGGGEPPGRPKGRARGEGGLHE